MLEFAAYCSEAVVSAALIPAPLLYNMTGILNVNKYGLPSRALTGNYKQCLIFTNQSIILKGLHSA
jgi:hypothetical protein